MRIVTIDLLPHDLPRRKLLEPPELVVGGYGAGGVPPFVSLRTAAFTFLQGLA
ncbi:MAG: hypothetical protein ACE5HQ_09100 [Gemmatimonadota bacterium]